MRRTPTSRLGRLAVALVAVVIGVIGMGVGSTSAHNTLLSSDPADGSSLAVAPTQITWVFDNSVPLDTMTVTLIDATGARTELPGSTHGPAGDTEVVTPLPALQPGPVSLRWRLVGPDGHPITGRVDFTIDAAPSASSGGDGTSLDTTLPSATAPPVESVSSADGDGSSTTPSPIRWVLRYVSYLAIMAVVGILLTSAYVWSGAGDHPLLQRILGWSLLVTAALGFAQLLVVASDISGDAPLASFGSIDAAITTDAGMAFMVRIVLALAMWVVIFRYELDHPDVYWTAVSLPGLGLLATWAFAGHASSMRWPEIGVIADVAHHAAAAAWIAGLAIVGWVIIPTMTSDVVVPAVRRFSRVAAISVAVLVVTGLAQTVRLVGGPGRLFDADHGRYLAIKILVLAVMLVIANANRRRVNLRLDETGSLDRHVGALRRGIVTEFAIGLVIIAITAAMVVSPPSTGESDIDAAIDAAIDASSPGHTTVSHSPTKGQT